MADGDVRALDLSRRNRNLLIAQKGGPCYLVKQGMPGERGGSIANEAAAYARLWRDRRARDVRPFLPAVHAYAASARVLVLELVQGAGDLAQVEARGVVVASASAAELGRALGSLYHVAPDPPGGDTEGLSHDPPAILALHRPAPSDLGRLSPAGVDLVEILQEFAELGKLLDELRRGWRAEALVHGDVKWDTCLVPFDGAGRDRGWSRTMDENASGRDGARLKLVDWELAGWGDPGWDAGSALGAFLASWLLSIPIQSDAPPDRFLHGARRPLESIRPAIRSFWSAYAQAARIAPADRAARLLHAVRWCAARLVVTAFEHVQDAMRLTPHAVCLLQLALNVSRSPGEAAARLLGLRQEPGR